MWIADEKEGQLDFLMESENGILFVCELGDEYKSVNANGSFATVLLTKSRENLGRGGLRIAPCISEVFITIMDY